MTRHDGRDRKGIGSVDLGSIANVRLEESRTEPMRDGENWFHNCLFCLKGRLAQAARIESGHVRRRWPGNCGIPFQRGNRKGSVG